MMSFPTRPIARLSGHNGAVHAVTYSSGDSKYILTGSSDRQIRLFNPSSAPLTSQTPQNSQARNAKAKFTPGLVQTYSHHGYEVLSLAVSRTNTHFVSGGGDKSIFVWDVQTAQTTRHFGLHAGRVNTVAFGGVDGDKESVVVSGSFDTTVKIWDLKSTSPKPIMTLEDAKDSIYDICVFDAEIIAASSDGRIRSYDLRTGNCTVDVIGPAVTSLKITRQGRELLVGSLDSTIRLMDRSKGELLKSYKDEGFVNDKYRVRSALGMDDSVVISGSDNGMVYAWDLLDSHVLHSFKHSEAKEMRLFKNWESGSERSRDVVSAVAFCPTRKEWASAGGDGNVVVWGV